MKRSVLPLLLAAVLGLLPFAGEGRSTKDGCWSRTFPAVNQCHIFEGEINKRGKPVGFHSRPGGRNPPDARVVRILDGPNRLGVYVARVEIRNREKTSSLFPDSMDRAAVLQAVLRAYRDRTTGDSIKFRGPSGRGFTIEGYLLDDGRINTAYPIYTGN